MIEIILWWVFIDIDSCGLLLSIWEMVVKEIFVWFVMFLRVIVISFIFMGYKFYSCLINCC